VRHAPRSRRVKPRVEHRHRDRRRRLPSLQLDALAAGRKHQIWIRFWASAHSLQVKDQAGTNIFLFNFVAGSQQTVQFYWSGTTWRVGMVGAQTVI